MCLLILCATSEASAQSPSSSSPSLFQNYSYETFAKLPQAQAPIDLERPQKTLLDAAVFHETNRRRTRNNLPPLGYNDSVRQAADLQARLMKQYSSVSHENPSEPKYKTLQDRLASVGLRPRFAGENVALTFGLQYESGRPFYIRTENGQKIFSATPDGPPMPPHTYLSFAKELVTQWMQSPGHRKNILHGEPKFLGTACRPARDDSGMPIFYNCQVFFTPL
jgi:uncharacterized protein YkwD